MKLSREAAQDLLAEGKAAFVGGEPSDACPYSRLGGREDQFQYRYWTRGWSMARSDDETARPAPASTGH
ncbi:ribosome modulation factor [Streptomyces anulatus]|uniref:ribosome modulation factor n=1 Tax=Streptomyces anulatus TaxID=1892 RepID=UPI003659F0B7